MATASNLMEVPASEVTQAQQSQATAANIAQTKAVIIGGLQWTAIIGTPIIASVSAYHIAKHYNSKHVVGWAVGTFFLVGAADIVISMSLSLRNSGGW